jgi:hypothetical protein
MGKKLITACMALAAFAAFAVMPAGASATNDPDLTFPTGTLMPIEEKIEGTNIGKTIMTNAAHEPVVECDTATMTGKLVKNDGSNVEGTIEKAEFKNHTASTCTSSSLGNVTVNANPATNGLHWCLRSTSTMATDEFQVRGGGCNQLARPIRFILQGAFGVTCTYQRTAALSGTYKTHPEDAILSITTVEFPLLEGGFLCPSAGFLDMTFTLEKDTTDGKSDPVYIS